MDETVEVVEDAVVEASPNTMAIGVVAVTIAVAIGAAVVGVRWWRRNKNVTEIVENEEQ